jgi:hypothetical protein
MSAVKTKSSQAGHLQTITGRPGERLEAAHATGVLRVRGEGVIVAGESVVFGCHTYGGFLSKQAHRSDKTCSLASCVSMNREIRS